MKRLFVGIPITPDFTEEFIAFQNEHAFVQGINWVKPANLHITLCFIGDYNEERLPELNNTLNHIAHDSSGFDLEFKHFQFGPGYKKAYMIWARYVENEFYNELASQIEMRVLHRNSTKAKKAHITLCRFKRIEKNKVNLEFLLEVDTLKVEKFNLYESILRKEGAIYKVLHEYKLNQ